MIDLSKRDELDRAVLEAPWPFVTHYCNDAAEVRTWIREAVRLMLRAREPFASSEVDYLDWVEEMCNHADKVKLEER